MTTENATARFKACLLMEDEEQATQCLIQEAKDLPSTEVCRPHLVMLTQDGCPFCAEEKEKRKAELEAGLITEVDIYSPRGEAIASQAGVDFTPVVVPVDCNDNVIGAEEELAQQDPTMGCTSCAAESHVDPQALESGLARLNELLG